MLFNLANAAIFAAIIAGVVLHHRRVFHVRTMASCFVADGLLLLSVELRHDAVRQALHDAPPILLIHVAFSLGALVLWVSQIANGLAVLRGQTGRLPAHSRGARLFLVARLGNLVTVFLV